MDVVKKLNELRLQRNLSVYRLAELSGLNQSTLANIFSRGTVPSVATLKAVCDTLGITLSQFFAEGEEGILLTKEEAELVKNYQKLAQKVKKSVFDMVKAVAEIQL